MNRQNNTATRGLADSQHNVDVPAEDRQAYDGVSAIITAFNEDMRAQGIETQELNRYRVKQTPLESYFVHNNVNKRTPMIYQMDLRTNKQELKPAAEIANAQPKTIRDLVEQIKSLHEKLSKLEQAVPKYQAELGELRIKNFIQETKIAKLEAELVKREEICEQVEVNGDCTNDEEGNGKSGFDLSCIGEVI